MKKLFFVLFITLFFSTTTFAKDTVESEWYLGTFFGHLSLNEKPVNAGKKKNTDTFFGGLRFGTNAILWEYLKLGFLTEMNLRAEPKVSAGFGGAVGLNWELDKRNLTLPSVQSVVRFTDLLKSDPSADFDIRFGLEYVIEEIKRVGNIGVNAYFVLDYGTVFEKTGSTYEKSKLDGKGVMLGLNYFF